MPQTSLPPEIGLCVIDHIGAEGARKYRCRYEVKYLRTLCICALICKDWLYRSRINLFRNVYIKNEDELDSLEQTLETKPMFRDLIQAIKFTPRNYFEHGEISSIQIHRALLLLGKIGPCTVDIAIWFDIRLNIVTRRCVSQRYQNIVQLNVNDVPASRVFHLVDAFPSLRTLQCSGIWNDKDRKPKIPAHIASRVRNLSFLTVRGSMTPSNDGVALIEL